MLTADYWAGLCPWLSVNSKLAGREEGRCLHSSEELAIYKHLSHQGFIKISAVELWAGDGEALPDWIPRLTSRLAKGIAKIVSNGHTPSSILVYDEAWLLQNLICGFISRISGGNLPVGDWFVFNVHSHGAGAAGGRGPALVETTFTLDETQAFAAPTGWPPHRDRPLPTPEHVHRSLREDGSAMYTTVWIPLTDATPESSCLYCIPAPYDPGYLGGDVEGMSPLDGALRSPADYQRILALPVPAGSLLAFTHRLLHWGSAPLSAPGTAPPPPRMALSLAFADPAFEPSYFKHPEEIGGYPTYEARMALVAAQALAYAHQSPLSASRATAFLRDFNAHAHLFTPAYVERVTKAGQWAAFTAGFGPASNAESGAGAPANGAGSGSTLLKGTGAPSAEEVSLLFAAYARAQEGQDATAYL